MTFSKAIILTIAALWLTACSTIEPKESAINDGLKTSPCACQDMDFNSRGFEWVG